MHVGADLVLHFFVIKGGFISWVIIVWLPTIHWLNLPIIE
jgi:hypothetical protein